MGGRRPANFGAVGGLVTLVWYVSEAKSTATTALYLAKGASEVPSAESAL